MSITHKIIVGDWSDDGHGKTKEYLFFTADMFTDEVLAASYKKNVTELGVDPTAFCAEYEDFILPEDVYVKLTEHGHLFSNHPSWKEGEPKPFGSDGMFHLLMFLIGYGLDGFTWTVAENPKPLIGTYKSLAADSESVGYGLFL